MTITNSTHSMTTRSKSKEEKLSPLKSHNDDDDDVDEYGNLKGFIDYDCEDEFDHAEFDKQVMKLGGVSKKSKKSKKDKKSRKDKKIIETIPRKKQKRLIYL